jgi:zinc/manganese transport system ATP-binding protein
VTNTSLNANQPVTSDAGPVLSIEGATFGYDERPLWSDLNLDVRHGEFIAIIGSNGSGKTSLLRAILDQEQLTSGTIKLNGKPIGAGSRSIGYIPQSRSVDANTPLRGKDLLTMGLNGHRFGLPFTSREDKARVEHILDCIDGHELARLPIGQLSGGQLQRFRVGQAVVDEPDLILADEPLSALDLAQQSILAELIDRERKDHSAAVLFVTHDVNPVLDMVDRVLYLANGQFKIGTPDEVLRSDVLSELYGAPVDVVRNQGRIAVLGAMGADHEHHSHEEWR